MTQFVNGDATSKSMLLGMLTTRRPAGSRSEKRFIRDYLQPLGMVMDKAGNYSLRIGDAPVLWSCHTDTVHDMGGTQNIIYTAPGIIGLDPDSMSNCLGADDTAGVWLMREMILAKAPGLYVFHRAEEIGCIGSRWIVKNNPELLKDIKFAIALDRKGKTDVVTHQCGRCCSDDFAKSLAAQLGPGYSPAYGVFTDTALYTGLVGECTNISVGYNGQHTEDESVDQEFLMELKDKLIRLDIGALVAKRKAGEKEVYHYTPSEYYYNDYYYGQDSAKPYAKSPWVAGNHVQAQKVLKFPQPKKATVWDKMYPGVRKSNRGNQASMQTSDLRTLVKLHPEVVAEVLEDNGINAADLEHEIVSRIGYLRTYQY